MALVEYDIIPDGGSNAFSVSGAGDLRITDANWALEPGTGDWLCAGWFKLTNKTGAQTFISKYNSNGNQRSWELEYWSGSDRFSLWYSTTGANDIELRDTNLGSPSSGVWYFMEFGRVSGSMSLRVTSEASGSRGTATTAAAATVFNSTASFMLGAYLVNTTRTGALSGQVDEIYYWQGTLPSSGELDSIFNAGAGISRKTFMDAGILYPAAAFTLDESTGNRVSWDKTRQLVPSGTTSYSAGKVVSGDFTNITDAIAFAVANKVSTDQWRFHCYSGDLSSVTATIQSIPTTSTGTVEFVVATGGEHDGTFETRQAAAFGDLGYYQIADADADNLYPGTGDFVVAGWVLLTNKIDFAGIISKFNGGAVSPTNQRTWQVTYNYISDRFEVLGSTNGTSTTSVLANNLGSRSTGIWYFIEAGRESGNLFIAVNRGTRNTASFSGTFFAGTAPFRIGSQNGADWSGLIDEMYYWSNLSGGTLPTSTDLDDIYNAGAGITKKQFIQQALPMPYDAWSFEHIDGITTSWGTHGQSLTVVGTIGYERGHIEEDVAAFMSGSLSINQSDVVIKRLQLEHVTAIYSGDNILFDGNLCTSIYIYPVDIDFQAIFQNNLFLIKPSQIGIYVEGLAVSGGNYTIDIDILNNTFISDSSFYGIYYYCTSISGTVDIIGNIQNNIVLGTYSTDCIELTPATDVTYATTVSHNITSDATGDIPNETFASTFVDGDNEDFTPLLTGPAFKSGATTGVVEDIFGIVRNTTTPDIGAVELFVASVELILSFKLPLESVQNKSTISNSPFEVLVNRLIDSQINIDSQLSKIINGQINIDSQLSKTVNSQINIESQLSKIINSPLYVEFLLSKLAEKTQLIENSLLLDLNSKIPAEFIAGKNIISDYLLELNSQVLVNGHFECESLLTIQKTDLINIEGVLNVAANNSQLHVDSTLGKLFSHELPVEFLAIKHLVNSLLLESLLNKTIEGSALYVELVQVLIAEPKILIEFLGILSNVYNIPIEIFAEEVELAVKIFYWCLLARSVSWELSTRATEWTLADRSVIWSLKNNNRECS